MIVSGDTPAIVDDIIVKLESVSIIHVPGRIPEALVGVSRICRLNGYKLMHGERKQNTAEGGLPVEILRYSILEDSEEALNLASSNGKAIGRLEIAEIGADRVLVLVSPANEGGDSTDEAFRQALVDLSREIYVHLKASGGVDDEV